MANLGLPVALIALLCTLAAICLIALPWAVFVLVCVVLLLLAVWRR